MATIAVGDIHGNLPALEDLLRQLKRVASHGDVVVFLGDYIDRGPSSKECVDAILAFQQDIAAEVVCLCGNHEDWLLQTRRDYYRHSWLLGMEAFETIRRYSVDAALALRDAASSAGSELYLGRVALPYEAFFNCVPRAHVDFFDSLRPCHESPDCVCAHGGLDPRVSDVQGQDGHWNNAVLNGERWPAPAIVGRTIGIDTIAHGVLTAIRLPDQRVFQSARYEPRRSDV